MSVEGAFASHLKADAAVAALVGSRIYRVVAPPKSAVPYIVMQRITADHKRHMAAAVGLAAAGIQLTCWDYVPQGAYETAEAVREATDHFRGTMGNAPNTATVGAAFLESEMEDYSPAQHGEPSASYATRQTWTLWYAESVPTF